MRQPERRPRNTRRRTGRAMLLALVLAVLIDARRGRLDALAVDGVELHAFMRHCQHRTCHTRAEERTPKKVSFSSRPSNEHTAHYTQTRATISPTQLRSEVGATHDFLEVLAEQGVVDLD